MAETTHAIHKNEKANPDTTLADNSTNICKYCWGKNTQEKKKSVWLLGKNVTNLIVLQSSVCPERGKNKSKVHTVTEKSQP